MTAAGCSGGGAGDSPVGRRGGGVEATAPTGGGATMTSLGGGAGAESRGGVAPVTGAGGAGCTARAEPGVGSAGVVTAETGFLEGAGSSPLATLGAGTVSGGGGGAGAGAAGSAEGDGVTGTDCEITGAGGGGEGTRETADAGVAEFRGAGTGLATFRVSVARDKRVVGTGSDATATDGCCLL